jgi:signal peptidase I
MKSKYQRKKDGPGWIEVLCGAALSLLVGIVLAVIFLVFKPVTTVKELPKEPVPKMVYYLEGTRDSSKTRELSTKRKLLLPGNTVVFNEDELNTIAMPPAPPAAPKKMELPQPPASTDTISAGAPNFRVRKDVLQVALPVELNAFELSCKVVLQARGGFTKEGDTVVFQPDELYVGSCPLARLPAVRDYVIKYVVEKSKSSDELATLWKNIADAKVEGSNVRVTMR